MNSSRIVGWFGNERPKEKSFFIPPEYWILNEGYHQPPTFWTLSVKRAVYICGGGGDKCEWVDKVIIEFNCTSTSVNFPCFMPEMVLSSDLWQVLYFWAFIRYLWSVRKFSHPFTREVRTDSTFPALENCKQKRWTCQFSPPFPFELDSIDIRAGKKINSLFHGRGPTFT